MTKSHYPEFQKASRTIADILINHQKDPKCIKCQKKIIIPEQCLTHSIKGMKMGKSKINNSLASLPFSFISGMFVDDPYNLLCDNCTNFIKRSIGIIPERWDSKWFPQMSTPLSFDTSGKRKEKVKWTIRYKKKDYPHTKQLQSKFMDEGVKAYLKEFPECPHSITKLKRLLNGYKLYEKLYGHN
jgi:hypothetical protein